jgi:hypothetical protein
MNVASSAERIELFNIALEVNRDSRDELLNDNPRIHRKNALKRFYACLSV